MLHVPGPYEASLKSRYRAGRSNMRVPPPQPSRPERTFPQPTEPPPHKPLTFSIISIDGEVSEDSAHTGNVFRARQILVEVARKHGFSVPEMQSARREVLLVYARYEAAWRMRKETSLSLPQIGMRLGGRDHTTIMHAIKRHEERMARGEA